MRSKWILAGVAVLAVTTPAAHSDEGWLVTTVDRVPNWLSYTSLAVLPSGHPAISYVETIYEGGYPRWTLKYARFDGVDDMSAGGAWKRQTVVSGNGWYTHASLAILPSGYPAISYYDYIDQELEYAWYDGSQWRFSPVPVDSDGNVGEYNSIAILQSGYPAISYRDAGAPALKYAWFDGGVWHSEVVADGPADYTSLAIFPPDHPTLPGQPAISYRGNDYPQNLRCAWFDGSNWQTTVVDPDGPTALYTSLAILPSGHPAISYCRYMDGDNALKYAEFDGDVWHAETVDSGSGAGYWTSLAVLPSGQPAISYAWIEYAWRDDDGETWHVDEPVGTQGTDTSMVVAPSTWFPSGNPAVSYVSGGELKYAVRRIPVIIQHPQDAAACEDALVTFEVVAEGNPLLEYQWHKDGADLTDDGRISGATTATLTIYPVLVGDQGYYDVLVTNPCGSISSESAALTVGPPRISEHPQSQTLCTEDSITFTVTVTGREPLAYQWHKKGAGPIEGATQASYAIARITPDDAGGYYVVITNDCGWASSRPALLTVFDDTPNIEQHPQSQEACVGDSVTFSVAAGETNLSHMSYQWRKDGQDIPDATEDSFTINSVTLDDAGVYRVVVTNPCGPVTSNPATLAVMDEGPSILQHPESQDKCVGQSVEFSVWAKGPGALRYQWYRNGVALENDGRINGATTANLTIDPLLVEDQGDYEAVVTNPCDEVTSAPATLTVADEAPTISEHPESQDRCIDESAEFSVVAGGPGELEYQWRKFDSDLQEFVDILGANENTYNIDSVTLDDAGVYDVVVTNPCPVTSEPATLIVGGPQIDDDPNDVTLCEDGVATFSVSASGVRPLDYQWRKNGNDLTDNDRITGAATANLTIDPALPEDTGLYDVVVTNRCATATSAAATLNVDAKPRVTVQPVSTTIVEGQSHLFCIAASGAETLTYQWQKDGVDIEDANVDCYVASEAATYRCVVTNHCGSATSDNATLTTVPALSATASTPTPAIKEGDSARLTATPSGGLAPYSYSWSTQETSQSITVTPAESTVYTVTVTDSLQQAAIAKVSVTVVGPMVVTARASAYTLAPGENSILTAVIASGGWAPFRYSWSTGETKASITVSPTQETTYSVTVTDSLDQTADAFVTIEIHDATAPPPEQPTDEDETDQSQEDVPPDDGELPPSDTDGTEEPTEEPDQAAEDVPLQPLSGLCPAVGLITIGLTLLGLWRTRPATRRGQRCRG